MIEAEEEGLAEPFMNKGEAMEQEDGEVSDASNCDVANDEGEIVDQQIIKSGRKEDDTSVKTDVNVSKKTALEKLKNMSFSSKSKLPVRSSSMERRERERKERQTTTSKLQHSPHRDNDEERRQRKRRWEERSDEQERHQTLVEERPKPLREAVAATHVTPLPINKPVEPPRPNDQPHTLRQRVEKVISVQESEAINMSDKELRNLIARMCDLSKEQQRLQRGRQTQFATLREIYMEVKDDIEKLYIRVPVHLRMDLPLPPQTLHPSASSSSGPLQINGGTTAFQLEQRFRLPSLFDPPNTRLNPSNDPEVTVRSEERCAGGRIGFGEVGNVPSDSQRIISGRNGTVYSGGLNERGIFEDMNRIGMGNGGNLLRNDGGSNSTTAVERAPHTDQSSSIIPSTSTCDLGPKPLFNRLEFSDGSSRFSGSGSSHELFPKVANDLPSQIGSFSDRPAPLMSFGNTTSPNQASHSIGRQVYDTPDKSANSTYAVVQTNALSKLEPGEKDGGIRAVGQHCFIHSGSQGPTSFIHPNKPPSPMPDFPSNVSLRVSNSVDTESTLCSTYHENLIHLKSNEIQSSSQVPLPNLSEPPPPFGTASINGPAILPNKLPNTVLLNTMQSANIVRPQGVQAQTVSASTYPSEHAVGILQPLSSTSTSSALNALSGNNSVSQNLQPQPGNATVAVAPPLMSLHSASSTVTVPPPDFSVPPPLAPSLNARTSIGTSITTNLLSHTESTNSIDARTGPSSNPTLQRSLSHMKPGVLTNNTVLSGLPSMNVPPPSFSVPPPRTPNIGPAFSTPPPMTPGGITSGPRPTNLVPPMAAPPPNLMSGPVGLNCPPPDMSQPPPNIRSALAASNPESVQQMVSAVVGQSNMGGQTPVEVVTELIANAYNRTAGVRLHHDTSLKQRMSMATENIVMINKIRAPAPAGPPRPLSSVGKLPPPLMLSPGTRGGPTSRISNFNKRKGSQIRPSTTRPQQRQKRQISDMVAIIPDEHDHPSSHEEPDDNIFLIVSDEEDGNK
ncbi:Caspase recruitment domain-containing protein [Dirofilaria immitis]